MLAAHITLYVHYFNSSRDRGANPVSSWGIIGQMLPGPIRGSWGLVKFLRGFFSLVFVVKTQPIMTQLSLLSF